MNSKRHLCFAILLPILLGMFISGCWDHIGIKERTIVIGMGIDRIKGNNPIRLTVQAINLQTLKSGEGGGTGIGGSRSAGTDEKESAAGNSVVIETSEGKSLDDAIHNFLKYSPRRMTFSHNRIVVLGMELAKAGIGDVFDDMARDYQFRATNWIFVAEQTAQEILESRTELGTVPAKEMDQMMINLTKNAFILPVNENEFMFQLKSEGNTGYAPLVQVENPGPNHPPRIMIEKTAILKNNRLIDILTMDESQSLLWFADKQKGGSLVFLYHTGKSQTEISLMITNGTTRITPAITHNGINIEISCTGSGTLYGMDQLKNNPKTIRQLEQMVEKIMVNRAKAIITKAQYLRADFLGYARVIHSQYPDEWHRMKQHWDQEFPRVKSNVHFKIVLARFGLVKDTILNIDKNGE